MLAKYGVPWLDVLGHPYGAMPWVQTNPMPLGWFHAWGVKEHPLPTITTAEYLEVNGLALEEDNAMPANNRLLVFRRGS